MIIVLNDVFFYALVYLCISVCTLLLNAIVCGLFRHRLTFRDYLDSFLFPVTFMYLLGVTIAGIYLIIKEKYLYTKSQIKNIKEKEALKKLRQK